MASDGAVESSRFIIVWSEDMMVTYLSEPSSVKQRDKNLVQVDYRSFSSSEQTIWRLFLGIFV